MAEDRWAAGAREGERQTESILLVIGAVCFALWLVGAVLLGGPDHWWMYLVPLWLVLMMWGLLARRRARERQSDADTDS